MLGSNGGGGSFFVSKPETEDALTCQNASYDVEKKRGLQDLWDRGRVELDAEHVHFAATEPSKVPESHMTQSKVLHCSPCGLPNAGDHGVELGMSEVFWRREFPM